MIKNMTWNDWDLLDTPPFAARVESREGAVSYFIDSDRCWSMRANGDNVCVNDSEDRTAVSALLSN